jgi:hypothetical protein
LQTRHTERRQLDGDLSSDRSHTDHRGRQVCQFLARHEVALPRKAKVLEKIPQELQTEECSDLLDSCGELAQQRSKAIGALRKGLESESYESALKTAQTYASSLETEMRDDSEFQSLLKSCRQALKEQQEAEEAADRQRALMKKLAIAGAAVTAVVLLIAAGSWIRSSMRASAIADAVQQQKWDAALAIDAQHVPALIGRANQRLNAETPDIDGAFADIGLAEQVDSTVAELKPAKALAHVKRAASLATDGKLTDAEKDLKEAEALGGSSDSQLTPVRGLLAAAYMKQAEDTVQSGNASQVLASASKAVEYDESTVIPPAVLQVFADESVKHLEQSSSDANRDVALAAIAIRTRC